MSCSSVGSPWFPLNLYFYRLSNLNFPQAYFMCEGRRKQITQKGDCSLGTGRHFFVAQKPDIFILIFISSSKLYQEMQKTWLGYWLHTFYCPNQRFMWIKQKKYRKNVLFNNSAIKALTPPPFEFNGSRYIIYKQYYTNWEFQCSS